MKSHIKAYLKGHPTLDRLVRLYTRAHRAGTSGYPDWNGILSKETAQWSAALASARRGPRVLVATSVGAYLPGTTLESLLSVALTLRGAEVHVLLCDEALPACLDCDVTWYPNQERFVKYGPGRDLCKHCFTPAEAMYRSLGLTVHRYSEFLTAEDQQSADRLASTMPYADLARSRLDGLAVGEHALAGALRFYARASLEGEPQAEGVMRRYFKAALLTACAARNLLAAYVFESAVFHHGIYVPQGLIGEVARQRKVRVVNWNPAYRKRCFVFSHGDTYHHTLMSEPVDKWEDMEWTPDIEAQLLEYLKSRWHGTQDWIWFHERPEVDRQTIANETGIDFSKPCIGMLTNVMWDAQLHYPANAFPNMLSWVLQTIEYFARRPELQLVIRVHPAEIRGTLVSRQPIVDEIRKGYPVLPPNVFVIPPESPVSTYAAMLQCNAVIIYGTKTGVELTSIGIPVIVAGEAWIRNKRITLDATSAEGYFKILDRLPLPARLDDATTTRSRRYAYHFFFRRMIPLEFMEPAGGFPPYRLRLESLQELRPGSSRGLGVICDGILKGTDFIYPGPYGEGAGSSAGAVAAREGPSGERAPGYDALLPAVVNRDRSLR